MPHQAGRRLELDAVATVAITNPRAVTELQKSIAAMDGSDLVLLVLVASHALNDTDATEMIADEIGLPVDQLRAWFDTTLSPAADPNSGQWHLAVSATL